MADAHTRAAKAARDSTTASRACSCPCRSQISSYPLTKCRSGVQAASIEVDPRFQVRAADSGYARTALSARVLEAIAAFGQAGHRVDLSIDGEHLVTVGAPKDPVQLQDYLELLAGVARAIDPAGLASYTMAPSPPGFGFYGHPDWHLIGRDDTLIAKYGLTTAGFGDSTEKVIRGSNDGLPIEAFIHRWKTRRTETYTDSHGRTQTRTVTENHSEILTAITMPFSFPLISVGGGWGGKKVRFEERGVQRPLHRPHSEPQLRV